MTDDHPANDQLSLPCFCVVDFQTCTQSDIRFAEQTGCVLSVQATINDITNAQTIVQQELQDFKAQPTHSEQIMQIVVFVFMFFAAIWYFSWDVKPFLAGYAKVLQLFRSFCCEY